MNIYSQENRINVIQIGFVTPFAYIINESDIIDWIESMEVKLLSNDVYQLNFSFNHAPVQDERWIFKIVEWEKTENIFKAKIVDIYVGNIGTYYSNKNTIGSIELNMDTNIMTLEFLYNSGTDETYWKIIWDNNKKNNVD